MTEAVVNGKETRCLVINNGDDLLTLKKVVSKKSDKDEAEKQKNNKTKKMNGSELNGNPNKTDSINFDVDNTSSLEPNLEMDSDTDRNITIDDSVCTQEDRELENIDVSNDNSNETDIKNDDKDNEAVAIQNSSIEYSPSNSSSDAEYLCNLEDYDLENVQSPSLTTSFLNISSRAPLHNNTDDFDSTLEEDNLPFTSHILVNEKKRKIEDNLEEEQKSYKTLKLWDIIKYPFRKITTGTVIGENQLSNISKAEDLTDEESSSVLKEIVTDYSSSETEELNESINTDKEAEVKETSKSAVNKGTFCSIM